MRNCVFQHPALHSSDYYSEIQKSKQIQTKSAVNYFNALFLFPSKIVAIQKSAHRVVYAYAQLGRVPVSKGCPPQQTCLTCPLLSVRSAPPPSSALQAQHFIYIAGWSVWANVLLLRERPLGPEGGPREGWSCISSMQRFMDGVTAIRSIVKQRTET